jgi:hypothetical protein
MVAALAGKATNPHPVRASDPTTAFTTPPWLNQQCDAEPSKQVREVWSNHFKICLDLLWARGISSMTEPPLTDGRPTDVAAGEPRREALIGEVKSLAELGAERKSCDYIAR